jgi:hypothetical protein
MPLPDCMPIVSDRLTAGDYERSYEERELTEPVELCDARGLLRPAAVGWSRRPLVRANLAGHWPRKKRWNPACLWAAPAASRCRNRSSGP